MLLGFRGEVTFPVILVVWNVLKRRFTDKCTKRKLVPHRQDATGGAYESQRVWEHTLPASAGPASSDASPWSAQKHVLPQHLPLQQRQNMTPENQQTCAHVASDENSRRVGGSSNIGVHFWCKSTNVVWNFDLICPVTSLVPAKSIQTSYPIALLYDYQLSFDLYKSAQLFRR